MTSFQFIGLDVAKDKFDIAFKLKDRYHHQCFQQTQQGYEQFLVWLNQHTQNPWVCREATGHYSEWIADFLAAHPIPVSIINPLQIKSFARMKLARNKNDQMDAKIIAEYAQKMDPKPFRPRPTEQKELNDLVKLLDTLKQQLVQFKNQLPSLQGQRAKEALLKIIQDLSEQIRQVEKAIEDLIKSDPHLEEKIALITSIKGVGKLTAYKILAQIPDIFNFTHAKQFAAYIGISPKQHQSGKLKGTTTISRIGNSRLRKALYMAALVAKRYNPYFSPFVARLKQNGKAPKAIICAVMRKLAHLIYGVLKNQQPFNVNFSLAKA